MADSLTKFGLSRRPAAEIFGMRSNSRPRDVYEEFGTPNLDRIGWSGADRRAVEENQAFADEEAAKAEERAALEDERVARDRQREAEAVADEFARIKEPSAREKFFDENEATIAGSKRYNQLAEMRQRQPSFADNVLAKNLANKIDDPDERNVFLGAVAKGAGTLAAREEADRFRLRRGAVAALTKVGVHPTEANRIADEEGYSPEVINYHVAQQEGGSSLEDPKARAAENHYRMLLRQATEEADESTDGKPLPETVAKIKVARGFLDSAYGDQYLPQAAPVGVPAGTGTVLRPQAETAPTTPPATEKVAEEGTVGGGMPKTSDDGTKGLRSIISNPDVPEVDRNVAFTELKTLLESQTPPKGSTFTEIAKFKNDLKERIDTARVDLEASRFREMVAPVWTREKDIVAKAIKRMAQDLGAEEDTVIASIFPKDKNGKPAEQQKIPMSIVPKEMQPMKRDKFGEREMYVKDLLAAYLADQRGNNPADASYERIAKAKIEDLSGWMEDVEKDNYPDKEVYKKAIRKVGLDADRTQEDVIREYIKGATPTAQEVAPVKAPSGREIKIGKPEKTP